MYNLIPTCPHTFRCLAKPGDKYNKYPESEWFHWNIKISSGRTAVDQEITQPRSPNIIQCFSYHNRNFTDEIEIYASKTHIIVIIDIILK